SRTNPIALDLSLPTRIPHDPIQIIDPPNPGTSVPGAINFSANPDGVIGVPGLAPATPPPIRPVHPSKPTGPIHVSSGVAAGQLIVPIQPHYPAIALATHTQGTVIVSALISTQGRIE